MRWDVAWASPALVPSLLRVCLHTEGEMRGPDPIIQEIWRQDGGLSK